MLDRRQMQFFTTETIPTFSRSAVLTADRPNTGATTQRVTQGQNRPFSQVLSDQRQWVVDHAPFDTVVKLPLMQFMTIAADQSTPAAAALVPFKDAQIQSNHPNQYEMTEYAMKQLLSRLKYDRDLFNKFAKVGMDRLNVININTLIQHYYKELVMLRCIDQNKIRGFLTDSYEPFDNLELLQAVEPYMSGAETHWDYSDDEVTHLSVTWPNTQTEIKVGDIVKTGIHISNSEVGLRSVTIAPYIYRLKCKNGATGREDGGMFRFRHTGDGDNLRKKVRAAIESTYMETTTIIAQFKESLNKTISDPASYMESIAKDKSNNLTQEQYKHMLDSFLTEPENNLYGVVNAITRTAHEYYTGETRYDLEKLGIKVLGQGLK